MSGIEVAGLVLAAFPIILNCLDYYREGFESLEEWWKFRTSFLAFIDDVRHQMMIFNGNMGKLLDPVIEDNGSLIALIRNPEDPRWLDGSLRGPLEQRLAGEHLRFLRIIDRINRAVEDLKRFLQINDDTVSWVGSQETRPWDWHLKRIRISFSKNKHKKVQKIATYNQQLEEILGYSGFVIPVADRRKKLEPVALFDRIREHARCVHDAIKRHWKCESQNCQTHQAHLSLQAETESVSLNMLFILKGKQGSNSWLVKQEAVIKPVEEKEKEALEFHASSISHVHQAEDFAAAQNMFENAAVRRKSSFTKLFSKLSHEAPPKRPCNIGPSGVSDECQKTLTTPVPVITVSQHARASQSPDASQTHQLVLDFCLFLQAGQKSSVGIISDESDRCFELSKSFQDPSMTASAAAKLVPLPKLLRDHHQARTDLSRDNRFAMAAHITSVLLQAYMSPWLPTTWSNGDICFLVNSGVLCSSHPYLTRNFARANSDAATRTRSWQSCDEEATRTCLFTVGVTILELIFGYSIETCSFRKDYFGADNKPNDQTDISTARRWAKKVLGECGRDISDVVRRCLDCSFGPRPDLSDTRFREAVYEGVVKPLVGYSKIWSLQTKV